MLVGSRHTAESLWEACLVVANLKEKTRLGPPGVDTEAFRPRGPSRPRGGLRAGRLRLAFSAPRVRATRGAVVFVGKLIVSKGVDLLLAAWPLVRPSIRMRSCEVAGFGEYEDGLRRLQAALERGDLERCAGGRAGRLGLEGGEEKPLPILSAFLADPPAGYADAAGGCCRVGRVHRAA